MNKNNPNIISITPATFKKILPLINYVKTLRIENAGTLLSRHKQTALAKTQGHQNMSERAVFIIPILIVTGL
jgi:hypothetical protein